MNDAIEKKLLEMPPTRLVKIIQAALAAMNETAQIEFIAKYIDARTSLTRLGANDPGAFIEEVEAFCLNCLNRAYYSSEEDIEAYFEENRYESNYYDDDWDYGEYYSDTEWAGTFSRLFKLAMMYIQSGDYGTGFEATSRLLSCLEKLKSSDDFLGTDDPMAYISTNWDDVFALHFEALFHRRVDPEIAIKEALRYWLVFGSYCDEGFLNGVKDAAIAKRYILEEISQSKDWARQRKCFELLARLYDRLGEVFDKAALASELLNRNVYFYLMLVEGLYENGRWQETVDAACAALARIQPAEGSEGISDIGARKEIRAGIQSKLADAYERLSNFLKAYETVKCMFKESPSYALYKRARLLSEKLGDIGALLVFAEGLLKKKDSLGFLRGNLLRDIYSYEGKTQKLLEMVQSQTIDRNYYDRKYAALSLIYRAANNLSGLGDSLVEYLSSATGNDGVADMILTGDDAARRSELLSQGADLLRGIISFHIGAANRSRYAKAAYYMCVARDIYIYQNREDEFRRYFQDVIQQNNRRPALKDEMGIVYGKAAVAVKKKV